MSDYSTTVTNAHEAAKAAAKAHDDVLDAIAADQGSVAKRADAANKMIIGGGEMLKQSTVLNANLALLPQYLLTAWAQGTKLNPDT